MKKKKAKFYRKTALELFEELMTLTVEDIQTNADICKRYKKIGDEYFKLLEKDLKKFKLSKKEKEQIEQSKIKVWNRLKEKYGLGEIKEDRH